MSYGSITYTNEYKDVVTIYFVDDNDKEEALFYLVNG
jgi:hypothetical protein